MVRRIWILDQNEVEHVVKTVYVLDELQKLDGKDQDRADAIGILEDLLDDTRRLKGWH